MEVRHAYNSYSVSLHPPTTELTTAIIIGEAENVAYDTNPDIVTTSVMTNTGRLARRAGPLLVLGRIGY